MRLSNVSRYFDKEQVYDAYTLRPIFRGQLGEFNDASSVGSTLRRRVLSIAPTLAVPTRRCVKVGSQSWLAGVPITDTFQGVDVRKTYNLRKATNLFELLTPAQACSVTLGSTAYAYEEHFKETSNTQTDSEYSTFWNVFFAPGEAVAQGKFLRVGSRLLRVRQAYVSPEDLRVAQSDELDADAVQSVMFSGTGTYDPITDTLSASTTAAQALQIEASKFYRWRQWAEADLRPGDRSVFVPTATVTPKVSSQFTMLGKSWRVVSFQPESDAWAIHARPV
jgi:hypothetical protein